MGTQNKVSKIRNAISSKANTQILCRLSLDLIVKNMCYQSEIKDFIGYF